MNNNKKNNMGAESKTKSKFNLLPSNVFEERRKIQSRAAIVTKISVVLPFIALIGGLIYFVIGLNIRSDIRKIQSEQESVESQIAGMQEFRDMNSLLVLKTKVLKEIIEEDVNPEFFFTIVKDTIEKSGLDIEIYSYGKERRGFFYVTCRTDSVESVTDIARIFRNHFMIGDIRIDKIRAENPGFGQQQDADLSKIDSLEFTLAFDILNQY